MVPPSPSGNPPTRSVERFLLRGPSQHLDPRIHAYRADLADIALASLLFAPHYARGEPASCVALTTPMLDQPGGTAVSELARGEPFDVLDRSGGWAWGRSAHDGYVGYLAADALGAFSPPTHVVTAPAALLFEAAGIKSAVVDRWPLGTHVRAATTAGDFLETADGFLHVRHVRALGDPTDDAVTVAEALIGTPYRWGGRGGDGIDCSGLVQRALGLAGIDVPRDSDQQRAIGHEIAPDDPLRRGDLLFFPGHVGIMADVATLIHANAWWMRVTAEPLAAVVARAEGGVIARRRWR